MKTHDQKKAFYEIKAALKNMLYSMNMSDASRLSFKDIDSMADHCAELAVKHTVRQAVKKNKSV